MAGQGQPKNMIPWDTRCGFTPQYKELESLYEKYAKDGFEILDFPCNQFGVEDLEADLRALSK